MDYLARAKSVKAKKRLGQNFLIDSNVIEKIIATASLTPEDEVLEIGAGLGFVTERLCEEAKVVTAVELDEDAVLKLQEFPFDNLNIIHGDILKTDLSKISEKKLKVVANIPYYITSPILVHLLGEIGDFENKNRNSVSEIILMVQLEVAKRIVATNKSPNKEFGLLSVLCNYWADTEIIQKVPAKAFYPAPKVDSAVVKLTIREPLVEVQDIGTFRKVLKAAFGQRRKTLKNALSMGGFSKEKIDFVFKELNIDEKIRGENLSIEEFAKLSEKFI